jgi:multimeric flavodoxin WrbA
MPQNGFVAFAVRTRRPAIDHAFTQGVATSCAPGGSAASLAKRLLSLNSPFCHHASSYVGCAMLQGAQGTHGEVR